MQFHCYPRCGLCGLCVYVCVVCVRVTQTVPLIADVADEGEMKSAAEKVRAYTYTYTHILAQVHTCCSQKSRIVVYIRTCIAHIHGARTHTGG